MMIFDNLEDPAIFTEHPCISAMGTHAVLDYVSQSDVAIEIQEQLDAIERHMRELLEEREQTFNPQTVQWGENITIAEFRRRRERGKQTYATAAGGYSVRYMSAYDN